VNLRAPLRLQLGKILNRSRVISEEVHPTHGIALREVVVHLGNYVVNPNLVGEPVDDVVIEVVIDWEALAIATYGGVYTGTSYGTARDLLAGRAYLDIVRL